MAGGGDPLSGLQDGDGMEDRLPAPPRIPDSAHGLVRATAIADSIGGGSRQDLRQGWYARRAFLADPAALPRQHAHGRRRGPYSLRARTNAGDAVLYASQDRRAIGSASGREQVCQYVLISVVGVSLKKKKIDNIRNSDIVIRRHIISQEYKTS